jgi:hypothetical protein
MTQTRPEIWKPVSIDARYEVSNHGRVRSTDMELPCRGGHTRIHRGKILTPGANASGHLTVLIAGRSQYVHSLVATAFLGPKPFPGAEVRHRDGDPSRNADTDLEWATRGRNNQDRKHHAGQNGRLTLDEVRAIKRRLNKGEKGRDLAFEYGIGESAVSAIKNGHNHAEVQP